MRFFLLLCALALTSLTATAQMTFVEKPFEDLLAQAKEQDKVIFIDAYTTWCGPCKMMAAKVFPDEEVGEFYNERFINAKFDMEKGEGPALAKRYGVMAYPTYLFVDGDGNIVHKGVGYIPREPFLELAEAATGPGSLGKMNARYDGGEREGAFIEEYIEMLTEVYDQQRAGIVINDYLANKEDWSEASTLKLLVKNPGKPGSKQMNYLLENASEIEQVTSSMDLMMSIQQVLVTDYMQSKGERALPSTEAMSAYYNANAAPLADRLNMHYTMFRAEQMNEMDAYLAATLAYYSQFPSNDYAEMNSAAWNFFENSEDPAELKVALGWARESVRINANYPNLDTLAWLLKKTGDDKTAHEVATRAIKMAKESGQDYSDTEKIFED